MSWPVRAKDEKIPLFRDNKVQPQYRPSGRGFWQQTGGGNYYWVSHPDVSDDFDGKRTN